MATEMTRGGCKALRPFLRSPEITPIGHANQTNSTWLVDTVQGPGVAKQYRNIKSGQVQDIHKVEKLAAASGVPVPRLLQQYPQHRLVVHERIFGEHVSNPDPAMVALSAQAFARQLTALSEFTPSWSRPRPAGLPWHVSQAIERAPDSIPAQRVRELWGELAALAGKNTSQASHTDWRADNLLFRDGKLAGVLDWEAVGTMPWAEALGNASASFTHSWRQNLHRAVTAEPIVAFLAHGSAALDRTDQDFLSHASAAAQWRVAVNLCNDGVTDDALLTQLRSALQPKAFSAWVRKQQSFKK